MSEPEKFDWDYIGPLLLGAFCCFMLGISVRDYFACKHDKEVKAEAIAAGVAHYTVNPVTGETKFVWKGENDNAR